MSGYCKNQRIWPKCRLLSPLVFGYVQCCVCCCFFVFTFFSFLVFGFVDPRRQKIMCTMAIVWMCVCVYYSVDTILHLAQHFAHHRICECDLCSVLAKCPENIFTFHIPKHCSTIAHNNRKLCTFRGGLHMDHKHNTGQYPAIEVGGILRQVDR